MPTLGAHIGELSFADLGGMKQDEVRRQESDMQIDAAHVHLMLNHLPVIGAPLLLLLLTIGLLRGSRELVTVSC